MMAKGDKVLVLVDGGPGVPPLPFETEATKAGRRVEIRTERGMVLVSETTRNGDPVRTNRFMASRIVALIEDKTEDEPAETRAPDDDAVRTEPGLWDEREAHDDAV
jgi:hypothetical protein